MTEIILFPKIIRFFKYKKDLKPFIKEVNLIKKKYPEGGHNWYDTNKVYNTNGTYNLYENKKFRPLLKWIDNCVKEYCEKLQVHSDTYLKNAWLNIYKKNQGQEYHDHNTSSISAVFFLKGSIKSAKILFTDFNNKINLKINNYIDINSTVWKVPFSEGTLIIFRADTVHGVEQHLLNEERVSIAVNYVMKK
jgi:hypothetical protein